MRLALPFLFAAGIAAGACAGPVVPADGPLTSALSDARVVAALHKMAAREGLKLTRVSRQASGASTVLTFHARPEGGAEQARLEVTLEGRAVRRVLPAR